MEEPESTRNLSEVEGYYQSALGLDAQRRFRNLDDIACLEGLLQSVQSCHTGNFVLDFSETAAWVSFDLSTAAADALISEDRPEFLNTRWINIWHPQHHKSFIKLLAKHYDFSPRLLALMISDPKEPRQIRNNLPEHGTSRGNFWKHRFQPPEPQAEVEKGLDELSQVSTVSSQDSVAKGNLYKIIDDTWHYSSIDFGRSYVCLGYNSLYGTKDTGGNIVEGRLPHCMRLWTWLVLCEDNTVISINEDPYPFSEGMLDPSQQHVLADTRRNLVNVFRSLSRVEEDSLMERQPLAVFPIRARLGNTAEETAHRLSDMPGLLFYYLFENWHNSYTLITRRESRYGLELKNLRAEMIEQPKLCHIDRLDTIGTELGMLKNHFESYNRLIQRLLEPQTVSTASLQNYRVATLSSQVSLDTVRQVVHEKESTLGVSLSSPARVRFERLKDLIDLYALTEVEEFIKQKDSLVAMVSSFAGPRSAFVGNHKSMLTYFFLARISSSSVSKNRLTSNV